jgi:hypothetical protein
MLEVLLSTFHDAVRAIEKGLRERDHGPRFRMTQPGRIQIAQAHTPGRQHP